MVSISVKNVSVEIPVYAGSGGSLKKLIIGKTIGGRFAHVGSHIVVSALLDIDLEAREGDRIGLIGQNGSGKTTLLRVAAGVYPPTSGSVAITGRVSSLFDISLGMSADATGMENIRTCGLLWGLTRREIENAIDEIVDFTELGDYLNVPVRTYSAGMLMRLSFAIATVRQPDILLLDEVIGVGDASFFRKAYARLEQMVTKSGILMVSSHSDVTIRRLCNRVVWLRQGRVERFGGVDEVLSAYNTAMAEQAAGQEKEL